MLSLFGVIENTRLSITAINSCIQSFIDQCWYRARKASRENISHQAAILFTSLFNDFETFLCIEENILFNPRWIVKKLLITSWKTAEHSGKDIVTFLL